MTRRATTVVGFGVVVVIAVVAATVWLGGDDGEISGPDRTTGPAGAEGDERVEPDDGPAGDDLDVIAGPAPQAVVAVQGPVDEAARYISVTWSHIDLDRAPDEPPLAIGYDIERDGEVVGSTAVDDDPWDDVAFRDEQVSGGVHTYRVRARFESGPGPWSAPAEVEVVTSDAIGQVFAVDDYVGSDLARAQRAVDDAEEAGGGIVLFGPATYELSDSLVISGNGVLLRGAGEDRTVLRAAFPGGDEPCGPVTPLLLFRGAYDELGVTVDRTAPRGDTSVRLDGPVAIEVGEFIEIDGIQGQLGIDEYGPLGIAQDPSTGRDERYPFEAGVVTAVDGDTITFDHPLSPFITEGAGLYRYPTGWNNGLELLTVEGAGRDDTSYHRLVDASQQIDFRVAEVTARWGNRNFIDAGGHRITVVGLTATEGGAAGYQPEPCKYKLGFGPATDVTVVDSHIGSTDSDENMSLITMQFVYRAVVRNNVLGQSRTYGINEHGGGSRDLVIENNWIGAGPSGWSGILLGNDTWGFGGETAIRNNRFLDNVVDVLMVENPYGVVIAGNRSRGCRQACVTWSGWGGGTNGEAGAIADPDLYGSARLTIIGNRFDQAANGLDLGTDESNGFPWIGIRDAVVADNVVGSTDGTALTVRGDPDSSGRLWVTGNLFEGDVETGNTGTDWWFWDNTAGPSTADEAWPDWLALHQAWEAGEVGG
ncbi:MAG: hypothetical protein ACFCVK_07125 [Acidimicrobiales bacterium]